MLEPIAAHAALLARCSSAWPQTTGADRQRSIAGTCRPVPRWWSLT